MEKQMSFLDLAHEGIARTTRREKFLDAMETVVPFSAWEALIEPFYYVRRADGRGRPPIGIERMLRMYLIQVWYTLSDEMVEDAIYDSYALQKFVRIDLTSEAVPDATTLLLFRRLLEENGLQQKMFAELTELLKKSGILMTKGTIVDATIVQAASSTKNEKKERDPYMKSTKKGTVWHFGCKAHVGVDAKSGLPHTVITTPANVHDSQKANELLHGKEEIVLGDSGYLGIEKHKNASKTAKYDIVKKLSAVKKIASEEEKVAVKKVEHAKCSLRAKVEHVFNIMKNIFKYRKARYRGEVKNDGRFHILFASVSLYMLRNKGLSLSFGGNLG